MLFWPHRYSEGNIYNVISIHFAGISPVIRYMKFFESSKLYNPHFPIPNSFFYKYTSSMLTYVKYEQFGSAVGWNNSNVSLIIENILSMVSWIHQLNDCALSKKNLDRGSYFGIHWIQREKKWLMLVWSAYKLCSSNRLL